MTSTVSAPGDPVTSVPSLLAANSNDRDTIMSIQIMRFLAAFGVAVYHSHLHLSVLQPGYRSDLEDRIFQIGASGVHVFFVISGFVMVLTSFRGDRTMSPGQFLKRRFLRIYPIYWVSAAAYLFAHQALGSAYALSSTDYVGAFLLLPSCAALIIGSGWTLAYEVYFYLAFGAALAFGRRLGIVLLVFVFAGSVAAGVVFRLQGPVLSILTNALLLEFLTGCALGLVHRRQITVPAPVSYVMLIGGLGGLLASELLAPAGFPMTLALGPSSALVVAGALSLEPRVNASAAIIFARLGDSSYVLYLIHFLVIDLLLEISPIAAFAQHPSAAILLSVPFAVVATVVAVVGRRIAELPLLRLLQRTSTTQRRSAVMNAAL